MNKALRVLSIRQIFVILLLSGLCQQVVAEYIGKVVRVKCVEQVSLRDLIWTDSGSGANMDYSAWAVPGMTILVMPHTKNPYGLPIPSRLNAWGDNGIRTGVPAI